MTSGSSLLLLLLDPMYLIQLEFDEIRYRFFGRVSNACNKVWRRDKLTNLEREELLEMYRYMYRSRVFQDRLLELEKRKLVVGDLYLGVGEEAVTIGSCLGLEKDDVICPHFRSEGAWLQVRGVTTRDLMAGWLGRKCEDGSIKQVKPTKWTDMNRSVVVRADSCVGSELDLAAGVALAFKLQKSRRVILVTFGDGTSNKGNFHEALTFASVQKLPVVFLCRNNGWAMSMPASRGVPVKDVANRAVGYGIPGVVVDGNDILAVRDVVKKAADRARQGLGPTLIEAKTYRLSPHSAHDEDDYRPKQEKALWAKRDPLIRFAAQLQDAGITQEELKQIETQCEQEVDDAENWALTRPPITVQEVLSSQQRTVNDMLGGNK